MRRLGLDIGVKRIGVAISDPLGISASPLEVLKDMDPDGLCRYVAEKAGQDVEEVVVGLPLTSRGKEGEQALYSRRYAHALQGIEGVKVILWDERYSTREAQRKLKEGGRRLRGRKADAEAAAVILQAYLDYRSGAGREDGEKHGH
jgi:putative Holliday junction resolvase